MTDPLSSPVPNEAALPDLGPLAWVHAELGRSLETANKAVRRFAREWEQSRDSDLATVDNSALRLARHRLHQAAGALDMVGLLSPATVVRAMEAAVQRFVQKPQTCSEDAARCIERTSFALANHLEALLNGRAAHPLSLFPHYRDVQQLAGAERAHPADLWPFENLSGEVAAPEVPKALSPDATLRSMFDRLVLLLIKTHSQAAAQQLVRLSAGLSAGAPSPRAATFWRVAAAFFEAVGRNLLPMNVYAKRAASRILLQFAQFLQAARSGTVSETLLRDLLFFCAQARGVEGSPNVHLDAVRAAFGWPVQPVVDYEKTSLGQVDPALLAQARKRIQVAKESWSLFSSGDDMRSRQLADQYGLVAESLLKLQPGSTALARVLVKVVDQAVRQSLASQRPDLAMEVATTTLYLEAAFEDFDPEEPAFNERTQALATRLEAVLGGARAQPLEPWMEQLYRRVSDKQTMGSVVGELKRALGEVEKSLDHFFRHPQERGGLHGVVNQFAQMRGVLSVLGLDQAVHAVVQMRVAVEHLIEHGVDGAPAGVRSVQQLGDNLSALGFLVDMLHYQPALAKKLFLFDETAGELRPVMGRSVPVQAPSLGQEVQAINASVQQVVGGVEQGVNLVDLSQQLDTLADQASLAGQPAVEKAAREAAQAVMGRDIELGAQALVGLAQVTQPAGLQAVAPPGDAVDDGDDLRNIFLSEAREMVAAGQAAVQRLQQQPADLEQQVTLRRVFHTLKGSARMVGLGEFAEAAWVMEQVFNALLGERAAAPEPLLALSQDALSVLARWTDRVQAQTDAGWKAQPFRLSAEAWREAGRHLPLLMPDAASAPVPAPMPGPAPAGPTRSAGSPVRAARRAGDPDDFSDTASFVMHPDSDANEQGFDLSEPVELLDGIDFGSLAQVSGRSVRVDDGQPGEAPVPDSVTPPGPLADTTGGDVRADAEPGVPDGAWPTLDVAAALGGLSLELVPAEGPPAQDAWAQADSADAPDAPTQGSGPVSTTWTVAADPDAATDAGMYAGAGAGTETGTETGSETGAEGEASAGAARAAEASTTESMPAPSMADGAKADGAMANEAGAAADAGADASFVAPGDHGLAAPALQPHGAPELPVLREEVPDEQTRVIGPLRVGIRLYNIFLNEADEWSRRLTTALSEWLLEWHEPVPEQAEPLAHALAGASATVGLAPLSRLARALEHALAAVAQQQRAGVAANAGQAQLFLQASEDARRLLHQFAAGFYKEPQPECLAALDALASAAALPGTGSAPVQGPVAPAASRPPAATAAPPVAPADSPRAAPVERRPAQDIDDDIDAQDTMDLDLFPIFAEEAQEILPRLGAALRQWVARPDNMSARAEVLRNLHTLKGSARLSGALRLGEMAHRLETQAERLGSGRLASADVEPLLASFDALVARFELLRRTDPGAPDVRQTAAEGLPASQAPSLIASLLPGPAAAAEAGAGSGAGPGASPVADAPAGSAGHTGGNSAQADAARSGAASSAPGGPAAAAEGLQGLEPLPAPRPLAVPGGAAVRVRPELLDRLVSQTGEVMITRSRMESELLTLRASLKDLTGNLDRLRTQLRDIELQAETQMQSRLALSREADQPFDPLEFDRFTRVQELTRMMAESVNDVATVQRNLQRAVESTEDGLAAQGRQARELQRDLLRTRMVEFEGISERLYRVVRQAAKETGKQVRLDILGGNIEIDRGVLDRMTAAFEHLLRNSVVHGIETPERRLAAGKPAEGRIEIQLTQELNDVAVVFRDDGAGLDLPRLRSKAQALGLLNPAAAANDSDAAQLVFLPGVTTASEVSSLAGRGVGMDVVRNDVVALGGRIEIQSSAGRGTAFQLLMPLTTAITQVVMMRAGSLSFGVPSNLVQLVHRATPQELADAYRDGTLSTPDEALPFFWSGALLQSSTGSTESQDRTLPVVIFRSAAQRVALHVDEVLGNQEVVVKNLGPQLSRLPGLAGMSVLASGAVVLIYNPVALAAVYGAQARDWVARQRAGVGGRQVSAGRSMAAPDSVTSSVPLVLVVDDSITVRRVTQRLLQREGYRVALASDGLQALERLQQELPAVVLSDIEMPRMDGFDLVRNIRSDPRLSDLPVIMITSRIAAKHREHAREIGVSHYLGKPYSEDELLALIAHYAQIHSEG